MRVGKDMKQGRTRPIDVLGSGRNENIEVLGRAGEAVQRQRHAAEDGVSDAFPLQGGQHLPRTGHVHGVILPAGYSFLNHTPGVKSRAGR